MPTPRAQAQTTGAVKALPPEATKTKAEDPTRASSRRRTTTATTAPSHGTTGRELARQTARAPMAEYIDARSAWDNIAEWTTNDYTGRLLWKGMTSHTINCPQLFHPANFMIGTAAPRKMRMAVLGRSRYGVDSQQCNCARVRAKPHYLHTAAKRDWPTQMIGTAHGAMMDR